MNDSWKQYAQWRETYHAQHSSEPQHTLVYLAAPYSKVEDKDEFMRRIMKFSGQYMLAHPGHHVVSPLFNHYSLHLVPDMAGDYAFWGDYSRNLLKRCDELVVLTYAGWDQSLGVQDEILLATALGLTITYINPVP